MKKTFLFIAVSLITTFTNAQTMERQLLSSAGSYSAAGAIDMHYSLGEVFVNTLQSPNLVFTTGFQQPNTIVTAIQQTPQAESNLSVYPNPAKDVLCLSYSGTNIVQSTLYIVSYLGETVHVQQILLKSGDPSVIRLAGFPAGAYLVRIVAHNGEEYFNSRIILL